MSPAKFHPANVALLTLLSLSVKDKQHKLLTSYQHF